MNLLASTLLLSMDDCLLLVLVVIFVQIRLDVGFWLSISIWLNLISIFFEASRFSLFAGFYYNFFQHWKFPIA